MSPANEALCFSPQYGTNPGHAEYLLTVSWRNTRKRVFFLPRLNKCVHMLQSNLQGLDDLLKINLQ